jgi:glycosyltransferase involved in cell wall biosynthesis
MGKSSRSWSKGCALASKPSEDRMDSREQCRDERGTAEQLTARFAVLWAEHRRLVSLAEQWAEFESSTTWVLVQRLARWRRRLMPDGSWRQKGLRSFLLGLRRWRREGTMTVLRRLAAKLLRRSAEIPTRSRRESATNCGSSSRETLGALTQLRSPSPTLLARVFPPPAPQADKFRVAFVGSRLASDVATMRYRAHNLIEALAPDGLEGTFVSQEEIRAQMPAILSHDLIVLVRRMRDDAVTTLIGLARRRGLPIVYDIDDYIFDPWVMPYIEAFQHMGDQAKVLRFMDETGACLDLCDYFTGSTAYLADRATALGKDSFVIRNGLNAVQLALSRLALEQRSLHRRDPETRVGYFSGSKSHQADFRVAYPALMRLLGERRDVRLVIVGHVDLGVFPGLAPFMDQIELLPVRHWSELPAAIAAVDVNIIPLDLTPFNEGKSNLKYFEAGVVEVPSIASPTRINQDNISHGHNGLLARTADEWYDGLKELVTRPDLRRQMGLNAFEHVMRNYTPEAVGAEAAAAYRQILHLHRARRDVPKKTLSIVLLVADPQGRVDEALGRANELAAAGHTVTVYFSPSALLGSSMEKAVARRFVEPLFALQRGGEVPCCDVLMAGDPQTADLAKDNQHRARLTIADDQLTAELHGPYRGLEMLLRDWVQKRPLAA